MKPELSFKKNFMEQINRIELRGMVGNVKIQNYTDAVVARLTVATNYAYKDKTGNAVIETAWHNVIAREGRNIQGLEELKRGDKVYLTGRLRYSKYTGSDGVERVACDVVANRLVVLDEVESLQNEM